MPLHDSLHDAINRLVEGLPREINEYIREGRREANSKGNFKTKLKGNIGRLHIVGNPSCDGNKWIAASFKGDSLVRGPIHSGDSDLIYIGSLPESKKLYYGVGSDATLFDETFSPLNNESTAYEDSEYLLLNALAHLIQTTEVFKGVAYLFTERVPCKSCTSVISEFVKKYEHYELHIIYMFDGSNRNFKNFKDECKTLGRVTISYLNVSNENAIDIVGPL